MESEKVKEIKELLRCMNGEKACTNCYINDIAQEQETCCINVVADMTLTIINELESENERLENENYKLEQNLGQCENGYKLELHTARYQLHTANEDLKKLKDRIAELEKENDGLKDDLKNAVSMQKEILDGFKNATKEVEENLKREIPNLLKQFAERLKEKVYDSFGDKVIWYNDIDETLKEFIK